MLNSFKKSRLIMGLTQGELANMLSVSTVTIHKWESGKSFPKAKRLKEVASVLNTTVEKLLEEGRAV